MVALTKQELNKHIIRYIHTGKLSTLLKRRDTSKLEKLRQRILEDDIYEPDIIHLAESAGMVLEKITDDIEAGCQLHRHLSNLFRNDKDRLFLPIWSYKRSLKKEQYKYKIEIWVDKKA